eukprot:scaffold908_cov61-Phaeocystis_antarctica.AAC.3
MECRNEGCPFRCYLFRRPVCFRPLPSRAVPVRWCALLGAARREHRHAKRDLARATHGKQNDRPCLPCPSTCISRIRPGGPPSGEPLPRVAASPL